MIFYLSENVNGLCRHSLSFQEKARRRFSQIKRQLQFFACCSCCFYNIAAAAAVDLSGNPYINAPPYSPPPLPPLINSPASHQASGGSKADMFPQFHQPSLQYRPPPVIDPNQAVNHQQWCRQNHPSYRPSDNTYRPFDKSEAMPPQMRAPCVSPYQAR